MRPSTIRFLALAILLVACTSPHEEPGATTSSPISSGGCYGDCSGGGETERPGDDDPGYVDDGECADPSSPAYGTCQPSYVTYYERGTIGARKSASIEIHLGAEGVGGLFLHGTYFDETKVTYFFDGTEFQARKNPSEMRFAGPIGKVFTVTVRNDGPGSIDFISDEHSRGSDSSAYESWCERNPPDVRPDLADRPWCFSVQ